MDALLYVSTTPDLLEIPFYGASSDSISPVSRYGLHGKPRRLYYRLTPRVYQWVLREMKTAERRFDDGWVAPQAWELARERLAAIQAASEEVMGAGWHGSRRGGRGDGPARPADNLNAEIPQGPACSGRGRTEESSAPIPATK